MASIRIRTLANGATYTQVRYRIDGRQSSTSFDDHDQALIFAKRCDQVGPTEALRLHGIEVESDNEITLTEWLTVHINSLTGVEAATVRRYESYRDNDIAPTIGHIPLTSLSGASISRWVQDLSKPAENGRKASGKTIQNKHAFLSGALKAAVHAGHIDKNPCDGRRLPRTQRQEMVFLERAEFDLILKHMRHDRWKNLATWLVTTGMRFSEATALTAADIDPVRATCRINKSWKYSGSYTQQIGPPKTRKSVRTINLPPQALAAIDLDRPGYLFANGAGSPVRSQEFFNLAWKPARDAAIAEGLTKTPRVHDLRHTCASWMINAGVSLPIVQAHLGHESIQTTMDRYGHLDRNAGKTAAAAIAKMMA